jgi:hypothetical protein
MCKVLTGAGGGAGGSFLTLLGVLGRLPRGVPPEPPPHLQAVNGHFNIIIIYLTLSVGMSFFAEQLYWFADFFPQLIFFPPSTALMCSAAQTH